MGLDRISVVYLFFYAEHYIRIDFRCSVLTEEAEHGTFDVMNRSTKISALIR